jgi:hypothetical protein
MGKAFIESISRLMRRVPVRAWLAVGGLLVGAFWLRQHDDRIRQQARLQQLRSETSAQFAELRKQAEQDVRQANVENAQAIKQLEARRQQVEQQNLQLQAKLASLRQQAQVQADAVATLPISEIVTRVATQLGLTAEDVAPSVAQSADMAKGTTTAPAGNRNQLLRDLCGTKALTRRAQRYSVSSVLELFNPQSAQRRLKEQITNDELPAAGVTSAPPAAARTDAALALTSSGARKVETALVELNACRAEKSIERQQISNGQMRAQADDATISRLNNSVSSLNQALDAKDQILTRQQNECKAELRAARGTFLGRVARLTEHVAIGVVMGVAIGVAVK